MEFLVTATLTQHLQCYVQADSLEEATKIADNELLTEEFEVINTDFNLDDITLIDGLEGGI